MAQLLPSPGVFWKPDTPHLRVSGNLEGEAGDIRLSVIGRLDEEHRHQGVITSSYFDDMPSIPIIHGVIRKSLVTLLDLRQVFEGFSAPGIEEMRYHPQFVVFGAHLDEDQANHPSTIQIRVSHLLRWLGKRGLIGTYTTTGGSPHSVDWNYTYPPSIEWNIPGFQVTLAGGLEPSHEWDKLEAFEYGYFTVRADQSMSIQDWYIRIITPLHEMLKYAVFETVSLGQIRLLLPEDAGEPTGGSHDFYRAELVVNSYQPEQSTISSTFGPEILFTAKDISDAVLQRFLDLDSPTQSIRDRLTYYEQTQMPKNDFFLSYVRLLESFHRRLNPISQAEIEAYKQRLAAMAAQLSDEDGEFVAGRLKLAYEPGLSSRLHHLARPWKTRFKLSFGGQAILGPELEKIARHRNFLAHELSEDERVLTGRSLNRANGLLRVVARLAALSDCGFTDEQAWDAVSTTRLFENIVRQYTGPEFDPTKLV